MGYNKDVMEKCKKLKEYAQYIARVRAFLDVGYDIKTAIDKATDECITEGILEQILRDNRGEVRSMLLTQYDEQAHIEYEKELSFEEGKEAGREEGQKAERTRMAKLYQLLKKEGRDADLEKALYDVEYCETLYKEFSI